MNKNLTALLLTGAVMALATSASAQNVNVNDLDSTSTSGAAANSGSLSGAQSNNTANNNAGIGSSENTNTSTSASGAISGSASASESTSNSSGNTQGQQQGQQANNAQDQGQNQGQMQAQDQQSAQANQQGVTFNQTWNTKNREKTKVYTNNAVPLTSSSSFSSDYCGGTVSGGASAAPIGISLGMSGTRFDRSCQSLRRAEKFGMAAVNAQNMGQPELSGKLMSMMIWSICTSDSDGTERIHETAQACDRMLLLGSDKSVASATPAQPLASAVREQRIADRGKPTVAAAARAIASSDEKVAAATPLKQ